MSKESNLLKIYLIRSELILQKRKKIMRNRLLETTQDKVSKTHILEGTLNEMILSIVLSCWMRWLRQVLVLLDLIREMKALSYQETLLPIQKIIVLLIEALFKPNYK
jgi:hypothetical protein